MSSTKVSSVRSKLLLRSGNLSRLTLWWVTADRWLRATSKPSSKSLIYKKEKKTSSSPIMRHRYTKRTIGWFCPSFSRCKEVQGQPQKDRGRTSGTMCTCEEIERATHAHRTSKQGPVELWWTQDGKLGITIQDPPPKVWKTDTFVVFCLFVLYSVTCLKTFHFTACFTSLWTSISIFYVNTASDVVTILLIFVKYLSLDQHIFTCTYRCAHTQAHMYNQHTRGMATTRHRSLVGRSEGRGFVRDRPSKKKKFQHTDISNLKRFEQIELQAKLLNYFLGSNKSNINQRPLLQPNVLEIGMVWTLRAVCCRVCVFSIRSRHRRAASCRGA